MRFFIFLLLISIQFSFAQSNQDSLHKHVVKLTELTYPRNSHHIEYLNKAADYIKFSFGNESKRVFFQKFEIEKVIFKNVIASFGPDTGRRIIIGANYDVYGNTPGADANASGVAGLLELGNLLSKINNLRYRIDLVAYALGDSDIESLKVENKGSFLHAKSLRENNIAILGMINLDAIGFFTDVKKTQKYPVFFYKIMYGSRANFISLYRRHSDGYFARQIKRLCVQYAGGIKVVGFNPIFCFRKMAEGDNQSYQQMDFATLKISNTKTYRNNYIHKDVDTYETLDYNRMTQVVNMIYNALIHFKE